MYIDLIGLLQFVVFTANPLCAKSVVLQYLFKCEYCIGGIYYKRVANLNYLLAKLSSTYKRSIMLQVGATSPLLADTFTPDHSCLDTYSHPFEPEVPFL